MRSNTSCLANQGSVPSLKMIVTTETSAREIERSSVIPGTPFSAFSIGNVTLRSTSRALIPGASVMTATWIVEMSGSASIGRLRAASPPSINSATRSPATTRRRRIERSISDESMLGTSPRV